MRSIFLPCEHIWVLTVWGDYQCARCLAVEPTLEGEQ